MQMVTRRGSSTQVQRAQVQRAQVQRAQVQRAQVQGPAPLQRLVGGHPVSLQNQRRLLAVFCNDGEAEESFALRERGPLEQQQEECVGTVTPTAVVLRRSQPLQSWNLRLYRYFTNRGGMANQGDTMERATRMNNLGFLVRAFRNDRDGYLPTLNEERVARLAERSDSLYALSTGHQPSESAEPVLRREADCFLSRREVGPVQVARYGEDIAKLASAVLGEDRSDRERPLEAPNEAKADQKTVTSYKEAPSEAAITNVARQYAHRPQRLEPFLNLQRMDTCLHRTKIERIVGEDYAARLAKGLAMTVLHKKQGFWEPTLAQLLAVQQSQPSSMPPPATPPSDADPANNTAQSDTTNQTEL